VFVEMRQSINAGRERFRAGGVYEVDDAIGELWIIGDVAAKTDKLPSHVIHFLDRLNANANGPVVFLPFLGEFGHLVMSHMRLVHFHKSAAKIVCCRPGEQVLFPSACAHVTGWEDPIADFQRVATMPGLKEDFFRAYFARLNDRFPGVPWIFNHDLTRAQQLIAVNPEQRLRLTPERRGLGADVVLGVRRRSFCPERNWQHWQHVADAVTAAGATFAVIGDRSTSFDLEGQTCHSGDYDTDAAVELLQSCRLYVGTDSGASHLASTVGARMIVFREEQSGSRNLFPRMEQVNPGRMQFVAEGWETPGAVADAVLASLEFSRV
jgi:hypothetical protein